MEKVKDSYKDSMQRMLDVKENFQNTYQNRKGFLGIGIGTMFGDYVLQVYVKSLDCCFVKELKERGSRFQRTSVRFFETGDIKIC